MRRYFLPIALSVVGLFASGGQGQELSPDIALSDPNSFVLAVQNHLMSAGRLDTASGQLDRATIRAINALCADAGLSAECQVGPLSARGARAVVAALSYLTEETGDRAVAEQPEPADGDGAVAQRQGDLPAVKSIEIAPSEWLSTERNGIAVTTTTDYSGAVATLTGRALKQDWVNISSRALDAKPGDEVVLVVVASFLSSVGGAQAKVRVSASNSTGYLGEVSEAGASITEAESELRIVGRVPANGTRVMPYIQVVYPQNAVVEDDRVTIRSAIIQIP